MNNPFSSSFRSYSVFSLLTILILTSFSFTASASEPVYAKDGMVAGPEPFAVRVGVETLKQGGNAYDAAVAVGFALAVTYPTAGNLGGGGFMISLSSDGESRFLDFREKAPAKASRKMYLDKKGETIEDLSTKTLLASGVPGTVHGLLRIQNDFGALDRERIIAPAIQLAEEGFPVSHALHSSLKAHQKHNQRFDSTVAIFYPGGQPPAFGSTLKQPELANTLRRIQELGVEGFYRGETANLIVRFMKQHKGIISHRDLENYVSIYREPIHFSYKNYDLIAPGAPSSGGVVLAQILKLIEPYPLKYMGYHSAEYIHTLVEAERLAFADRNYLGDPDFSDIPQKQLMTDKYLNKRRDLIHRWKAGKSEGVEPGKIESGDTTHYCVVDRDRNVVAITYTLNGSYGNGAVVEGAGFFLNNEMDDFAIKPGAANMFGLVQGEANTIQPGKRMLSCMTPAIVTRDGQFYFTCGTPGGPTIITSNAQIILNLLEFDMNIREAIDAPRFHHQWLPDEIAHEPFAFSPDTEILLFQRGYSLKQVDGLGFATGIQVTEDGLLSGYSDRRGNGLTLGY